MADQIESGKEYILGMDVGGTSIRAQLFELKDGELSAIGIDARPRDSLVPDRQGNKLIIATKTGKDAFSDQVSSIIDYAYSKVEQQGSELKAVGIGMPGRFNKNGILKPGTATNLENSTLGEDQNLSHFAPNTAFSRRLKRAKNINLTVRNDADAALEGKIDEIKHGTEGILHGYSNNGWQEPHSGTLLSVQTALFGIGTGLGHSIAVMDNGHAKFVTDGHASKHLIEVDPEDVETLEAAKTYLAKHRPDNQMVEARGKVQAEYLFNDPTICAIAGVSHGADIKNQPQELQTKALAFAGKYMARTIAGIASGANEDISPEQGWSKEDKKAAARTVNYIIGGEFCKYPEGRTLIEFATVELEKLAQQAEAQRTKTINGENLGAALRSLRLLQYTGEPVAERSAAAMALDEYKKQQERSV